MDLSDKIKFSAFKISEDETLDFIDKLIYKKSNNLHLYFGSMKFEDVGVLQFNSADNINFQELIIALKAEKDDGLFIFCNQDEQYRIDIYFNENDDYDLHFHSYEGSLISITLK